MYSSGFSPWAWKRASAIDHASGFSHLASGMTSRAIQLSILQVTAGIAMGATIEALLPRRVEGASLTQQVFEALVQTGLNGAALSVFVDLVRGEGADPTFGIPFSMALYSSQSELRMRFEALSMQVKARVAQASRQMVPPSVKA